jgi:hypothetical protein
MSPLKRSNVARAGAATDENVICWENTEQSWAHIIDFYRHLETGAVRRHDGTLDVETKDDRTIVRAGGWLVRRGDSSIEVYPP